MLACFPLLWRSQLPPGSLPVAFYPRPRPGAFSFAALLLLAHFPSWSCAVFFPVPAVLQISASATAVFTSWSSLLLAVTWAVCFSYRIYICGMFLLCARIHFCTTPRSALGVRRNPSVRCAFRFSVGRHENSALRALSVYYTTLGGAHSRTFTGFPLVATLVPRCVVLVSRAHHTLACAVLPFASSLVIAFWFGRVLVHLDVPPALLPALLAGVMFRVFFSRRSARRSRRSAASAHSLHSRWLSCLYSGHCVGRRHRARILWIWIARVFPQTGCLHYPHSTRSRHSATTPTPAL